MFKVGLNEKNSDGHTALHVALLSGSQEVAEILLNTEGIEVTQDDASLAKEERSKKNILRLVLEKRKGKE